MRAEDLNVGESMKVSEHELTCDADGNCYISITASEPSCLPDGILTRTDGGYEIKIQPYLTIKTSKVRLGSWIPVSFAGYLEE